MESSHNTVQKTVFHNDNCYIIITDHCTHQKNVSADNQQTIVIDEKPLYDNWIIG